MKKIAILIFSLGIAAVYGDVEPPARVQINSQLKIKLESFYAKPTDRAQAMRSQFSDEELQQILEDHKNGFAVKRQRIFWLFEEFFKRDAQRKAETQLKYLFLAVLLFLALLTIFIFKLYRAQIKLSE